MPRHACVPVSRADQFLELRREVTLSAFAPSLRELLLRLRKPTGVTLLPSAQGVKGAEYARILILPVLTASSGQKVDDLLQALTLAFGDPWDRVAEAHVLCLGGRPLGEVDRVLARSMLEKVRFIAGLTPAQEDRLRSGEGLSVNDLSPAQRERFRTVAADAMRRYPVAFGSMGMRRLPANGGTFTQKIYVDAPGRAHFWAFDAP